MEFHVDYWNRLGWVDRFSNQAFTDRQRRFAELGEKVGVLEVSYQEKYLFQVTFKLSPENLSKGKFPGNSWILHGALLGNGLSSKVIAGENAGRNLEHSFVVLVFNEIPMTLLSQKNSPQLSANIKLNYTGTIHPTSQSVAFGLREAMSLLQYRQSAGYFAS
jgi:hypothetical protein